MGPEDGAFFVWRQGRIDAPPLRPFPFDPYQLTGAEHPPAIAEIDEDQRNTRRRPSREPRLKSGKPPEEADQVSGPSTRVPHRPKVSTTLLLLRSQRAIWAVAAVMAAMALVYAAVRFSTRPAAKVRPAVSSAPVSPNKVALGLGAKQAGGDLLLLWDRQVLPVKSAVRGTLVIRAGDAQELPLTTEQLQAGSVHYTPKSDQIAVTLRVIGGNDSVSEDSIIVLLRRERDQRLLVLPRPESKSEGNRLASASLESQPLVPRRFIDIPQKAGVKPVPQLQEPPPKISLNFNAGPAVSLSNNPPALPPPAAPDSAPTVVSRQSGTAEAAKRPSAVATPAVPIYQENPPFPPGLKSLLFKPEVVEVRASIDARGNVIKAEAVSQQKGGHELLRGVAVNAARKWKFRPATLNGVPIAGEASIQFVFTPDK